ncbi:MAG: hypothetical protein HZB62_12015 [Nitrospirae bacterium]|nr:hypothetical protein [Nitrospirota bacterium]
MNDLYDYDFIVIGFVLIAGVIGLLKIIQNYRGTSYKDAFKVAVILILCGLLFVCFSATMNSFIENNWEKGYLISFLLLREVTKAWFFRHICAIGYIFLILGVTALILATCKRRFSVQHG